MNNIVVCSNCELNATRNPAFWLRPVVRLTSLQLQKGNRLSYLALQAAGDRT